NPGLPAGAERACCRWPLFANGVERDLIDRRQSDPQSVRPVMEFCRLSVPSPRRTLVLPGTYVGVSRPFHRKTHCFVSFLLFGHVLYGCRSSFVRSIAGNRIQSVSRNYP